MRTSINLTGRLKILPEEASIELFEGSDLHFRWNLSDLEIQSDFEGILEISSLCNSRRVLIPRQQLLAPGEIQVSLADFLDLDSLSGRFKIVRCSNDGMRYISHESSLLNLENDKLKGQHGKSLLDVIWESTLKVPWRLFFEEGEPILKVSNYYEDAPKIYLHSIFQMNVVPEMLRQIAFWLLTEDPDENQNSKISHWWEMLHHLGLSPEERGQFTSALQKSPEEINEINRRCQELSDEFSTKNNILQRLHGFILEEES